MSRKDFCFVARCYYYCCWNIFLLQHEIFSHSILCVFLQLYFLSKKEFQAKFTFLLLRWRKKYDDFVVVVFIYERMCEKLIYFYSYWLIWRIWFFFVLLRNEKKEGKKKWKEIIDFLRNVNMAFLRFFLLIWVFLLSFFAEKCIRMFCSAFSKRNYLNSY